MQALTQCWFTRVHRPERLRSHEDDGSVHSTCRYCERRIVTWDATIWFLADGVNMTRLAATASGRTLTLVDVSDDYVVHRFAITHLNDEEAIEAFRAQVRADYGMDDADSTPRLVDSAPPSRKRTVRPVRRVRRAAPDSRRDA